jgi:hypothetical protein
MKILNIHTERVEGFNGYASRHDDPPQDQPTPPIGDAQKEKRKVNIPSTWITPKQHHHQAKTRMDYTKTSSSSKKQGFIFS